jgi:hypothetical protein
MRGGDATSPAGPRPSAMRGDRGWGCLAPTPRTSLKGQPDLADALALTFAYPVTPPIARTLRAAGRGAPLEPAYDIHADLGR